MLLPPPEAREAEEKIARVHPAPAEASMAWPIAARAYLS
jgi:hypothetical protein